MDDIQPKLLVPVRADALIAEKHGIRHDHHAPCTQARGGDQPRIGRIRARRSPPRELRVRPCRRDPARAVKARLRDAVGQRRAAVRLAEKPLRVVMNARRAINGRAALDPQPGRRKQVVEIVAIFLVLILRDHEQPAARADKGKDVRDLARREHGRTARGRALPARVARVQQHEHPGPGERGTFQRPREMAGDGEIARGEQIGGALIR